MLLRIHPQNPEPRKVSQVTECLLGGGVIIYPTDTIYSFGCDMMNNSAVERIAQLKHLRSDKAFFSLVCADFSHLSTYCKPIDNSVFKLMRNLLPGPYTFILEANKEIPKIFSARKKTIGMRVPDNAIALAITRAMPHPLIASSVHDEDEIVEYLSDPELIHEKFGHLVDLVIDGGAGGLEPSTILDCTGNTVTLLRQGKGEFNP